MTTPALATGRPVRSDTSVRLVAVAVGAVVAGAALLGLGVRSTNGGQAAVDEPQYLLSALSLAEDGDLSIADELAAGRQLPFHQAELPVQTAVQPDGDQVSPHDPLLAVVLAVPMGVGGWVAAKATLAVLAGALAALTTWVAVARFGVRLPLAAVTVAVAGASAPLVVYGSQVYPELPSALVVVATVAAITSRRRPGAVAGVVGMVAGVVALPWLSIKYVPVAAVLALLGLVSLWRSGRQRAAGWATAALATTGLVYLAAHQVIYGGWTAYASGDHFARSGEFGVIGFAPDLVGRATRLVGLLVDRDFGMVAWAPAGLLLVPAVAAVLHRRRAVAHAALLVAPLIAGWLGATFVALTMHGYWWPGRQVVVVLPLGVLAVCVWLDRLTGSARRWAITTGSLLAVAGLGMYARLLVEGWAGRLTWVGAPDWNGGPVLTALRFLLPDYREPGPGTWVLHGAWVVALAALALVGWRTAGRAARRSPSTAEQAGPAHRAAVPIP